MVFTPYRILIFKALCFSMVLFIHIVTQLGLLKTTQEKKINGEIVGIKHRQMERWSDLEFSLPLKPFRFPSGLPKLLGL